MARQALPCQRGARTLAGADPTALTDAKKRLRRLLRQRRRALSPQQVAEKSRRICARLQTFAPFEDATRLVLYAADDNEVQTEAVWAAAQSKAVYYPRVSPDRSRLEFVRRYPHDRLVEGVFGIPVPPGTERLAPGQGGHSLVLTPGLGFDAEGCRLGRGKGYYDRAFGQLLAGALRVGVAYDCQVVDRVPGGPRDERVDWIVTESRLIDCRAKRAPHG